MPQTKHPHPGIFLAAEGVDGAGKSWAIEQLQEIVARLDGKPPVLVREPGGTPFGEALRKVLTEFRREISPEAQAMTFNASRRELADQVIRPALMAGKTVIADRWTPSTRVYQRGCPRPVLDMIIDTATAELADADLTILFTRNPAEAVDVKIAEYGEERRATETAYIDNLQNLYLEHMQNSDPGRWIQCRFNTMENTRHRLEEIYRDIVKTKPKLRSLVGF